MRTFLAFKSKRNINESEYIKKIDKVKRYYESKYLEYKLSFEQHIYKNIGIFILDNQQKSLTFPSKVDKNNKKIFTFFPPINLASGSSNYSEEIENICNKINDDEKYLNMLPSPFLFSEIDESKEELTIYPDMMGINRLYKLENNNGVYWSNRPAALLIFADEEAEIDLESWNIYAVSGWFMNNLTPFQKIERVGPSVVFKAKCNDEVLYQKLNTNSIEHLLSLNSSGNVSIDDIAKDIVENLKNFQSFWNVEMQVDISGGLDSRVSAASVVKSGIQNFSFRSISDIDAEVDTAQKLLNIINNSHDFKIINPKENINKYPNLSERLDRLLFEFDGDFATVMMNSPIIETNDFKNIDKILINGFGGEIAKGAFYTNQKWIDKLLREGDDAVFSRLNNHLIKLGCVSDNSILLMQGQLKKVLQRGREFNVIGLKLLDYFYFSERIRRWSPLGDIVHAYSPFLSTKFISAGLNADPIDNMNTIFHKELINILIPEWKSVPFFKATPEQSREKDNKNLRIWQTSDKYHVERVIENSSSWNDSFDEKDVVNLWEKAQTEGIPNYQETLFQRVILRAHFNNHLKNINDVIKE